METNYNFTDINCFLILFHTAYYRMLKLKLGDPIDATTTNLFVQ
jgi:hypothetical protein